MLFLPQTNQGAFQERADYVVGKNTHKWPEKSVRSPNQTFLKYAHDVSVIEWRA